MLQQSCCKLLLLLLFMFLGQSAFAQIEPDTVKRKESLPTGPPVTAPPVQRRQPPVQQQPQPVVVQRQPEVKEKQELIDRLYWGGSLGLRFGTYTNISLLPIIGYRLTDRLSVGGGVVYNYIGSYGLNMQNYGGRAFAQAEIIDIGDGAILAHGEVEVLSSQYPYFTSTGYYRKERKTISLPMVGVGYRQRISDRASFDLLLLYNGTSDIANPYSNPVIRGGINLPFRK